jgi:hypothetical protein
MRLMTLLVRQMPGAVSAPGRHMHRLAVMLSALASCPPVVVNAQPAPRPAAAPLAVTGVIAGRVVAAGSQEPLVGATVRVLPPRASAGTAATDIGSGGPRPVQTDESGRFLLRGVPPGIARIEVRRIGFFPVIRGDLAVNAAKPVDVTIELAAAPTQLSTITTRPTYFSSTVSATTPLSTQSFSAEEVRRTPGVQEDVVRAVSVLPGVGVTTAGRNDLVVRGGAPFENLFVVDNVEVPNINHFGTQGSTGGPISIINIDFVNEASLSAGGFGVRYGDRTASVTNIQLREGTRERLSTELNLSATGAGVILEGPIGGRNGSASFLLSARRSYLDFIFGAAGFGFVPAYADITTKAVWRPTPRDQLSFLLIGAQGRVTFNDATAENRFENSRFAAPRQDQYFSGLTWRRTLGRGVLTTTLGRTWTQFATVQRDSGVGGQPPAPVFVANSTEGETTVRSDLTLQASDRVELEAGTINKFASALDFDLRLPGRLRRDAAGVEQPLVVDTSFTAFRSAAYLQTSVRLTDRLRATVGGRADYYAFLSDATRLAPRASLSYQLGQTTTLSLSAGRYWQAPQFIWLVGAPSNAAALRPFRADQVVAGWSRLLRPDLKLQVEAYVKRYGDFPARVFRPQAVLQPAGFDDVTNDIPFGLEPLRSAGRGEVTGAEIFLQKKLSEVPVYGLLSVSYNRSRFTSLDGTRAVSAFDTPLIANGLIGWRPNAKWELSTRVRTATGLPTTPFTTTGPEAGTLDFTRYNAGGRLPAFFTLDLRVDRRWQLGRSQLITYLDVQNVTARQNVSRIQWNGRTQQVDQLASIGLLPSIGVNWEF